MPSRMPSLMPWLMALRRTGRTGVVAGVVPLAMVCMVTSSSHAGLRGPTAEVPAVAARWSHPLSPSPPSPPSPPSAKPPEPPAARYARLGRHDCERLLAQRGAEFEHIERTPGVYAPVRLRGPLHGVTFRANVPESERDSTPLEIVDCRLALALDDFAAQLSTHDIVEVVHFSMYRPPSKEWPSDKLGTHHVGALAIDAATFKKRDGHSLVVDRDFHGRIGARPCGPGSMPEPPTREALELRNIACDAAEAKLFNVELTPDFNGAHHNHFHLEVMAAMPWWVLR